MSTDDRLSGGVLLVFVVVFCLFVFIFSCLKVSSQSVRKGCIVRTVACPEKLGGGGGGGGGGTK